MSASQTMMALFPNLRSGAGAGADPVSNPVSLPIDPASLSPFLRMLLTADGTVTELLQARYLEPIRVIKLGEEAQPSAAGPAQLGPGLHWHREVLLQGADSGRACLHACSVIAIDSLPPGFYDRLRSGDTPLGALMNEQRLETFRELLAVEAEPGGAANAHLGRAPDAPLVRRTYLVWHRRRPMMQITERFPADLA